MDEELLLIGPRAPKARAVAEAATLNQTAAEEIESVSTMVTEQASKHAGAAESVTAAAEEQSASTQEMAAAAATRARTPKMKGSRSRSPACRKTSRRSRRALQRAEDRQR